VSCSSGSANFGLYLDGVPVPKTAHSLPYSMNAQARESVVVTTVSSGTHAIDARYDCPSGNVSGVSESLVPDWTVLLLG